MLTLMLTLLLMLTLQMRQRRRDQLDELIQSGPRRCDYRRPRPFPP